MTTYKEKFDSLYQLIARANGVFYSWRGLQKKEYEKIFNNNKAFWVSTLISMEENWLNQLANLYEEGKYSKSGKLISIPSLIIDLENTGLITKANAAKKIIKKNYGIIKNIGILRNHQLSHNNVDHLINPKNLLKKFPIKYKKVEDLLKISGKLLSALNPDKDHGYAFERFNEDAERDSQEVIKKLAYFEKLKSEHLKKFKSGEVNSPMFPPEEA